MNFAYNKNKYHNTERERIQVCHYREKERRKILLKLRNFIKVHGGGIYDNHIYKYIIQKSNYNLWHKIRYETLKYFDDNRIGWWENDNHPTGHLLSSQIQCLNILFPIRKNKSAIIRLLRGADEDFIDAEIIGESYIEFEYTGNRNYLNEREHTRGKNSTSIDAVMMGVRKSGKRVLVAIEWKYTECYKGAKNKLKETGKGETRRKIYLPFLTAGDTPFTNCDNEDLFYEPFYQLMRQTLLAKKIAGCGERGISDYMHLHIIPKENHDLINEITSPGLCGETLSDTWKNVLKEPDKYRHIDTKEFIRPIFENGEYGELKRYLDYRYFS